MDLLMTYDSIHYFLHLVARNYNFCSLINNFVRRELIDLTGGLITKYPIKYYSSVSGGLRETKAASGTVVMALLNLPYSSLIFHT